MAVTLKINGKDENIAVIGQYQLVSSLGSGGEGQVLDVRDTKTGEHLAMKARFAVGSSYTKPIESLFNARRLLQEVGPHDHIIQFVKGDDVDVPIQREGKILLAPCYFNLYEKIYLRDEDLSPQEIARIGAEILSACAALHEKRWVHRDVTPKNILIDSTLHARLSDFGIAYKMKWHMYNTDPQRPLSDIDKDKEETWLAEDGSAIGTPCYMSPEQTMQKYVGPVSDTYNLGAALYHMLTGRPPHEGDIAVVMYKTKHEEPEPISSFQNVPKKLENVVMKMLEKDPVNRGDERELESDLRKIAEKLSHSVWNLWGLIKPKRPRSSKAYQTTSKVKKI